MAKKRKSINNKIEVFDIVVTDDKNFSKDNFSKGVNRRLAVISKNKKKGLISVVKTHSLGNNSEIQDKRKLKEKKGQFLKINDGNQDIFAENILHTTFADGDSIRDKYDANRKLFPSGVKVSNKDRERLYNHVMKNKKQKNISKENSTKNKKMKSNKRKRRK